MFFTCNEGGQLGRDETCGRRDGRREKESRRGRKGERERESERENERRKEKEKEKRKEGKEEGVSMYIKPRPWWWIFLECMFSDRGEDPIGFSEIHGGEEKGLSPSCLSRLSLSW